MINDGILYCTTFNKKLFDTVGKNMLMSFMERKPEGDLLICYEDNIFGDIYNVVKTFNKIKFYNLENNFKLTNWLYDNRDIIPVKYGGEFKGCNCSNLPSDKHFYKNHIRRCPGLGFNMRAACWFRKIIVWDYAQSLDYDIIFFLDADTLIKKSISESYVQSIFGDADMFYQLGLHRKRLETGIESGIIGWRRNGYFFINKVLKCFLSKNFLKYDRWDDGYIVRKVLEETPEINAVDIVGPHMLRPFAHVTPYGKFANYIQHDKGSTTHIHKIFTDSTAI